MRLTCGITAWTTLFLLVSTASAAEPPTDEPLPRGAYARLGTTRFHADEPIAGVALSPDATRLAVTDYDGHALLFDAATGRRLLRFEYILNGDHLDGLPLTKMAFSRDGGLLAIADWHWLSLYDTTTGKLLALLPCHSDFGDLKLSFTADGRSLLLFDAGRDNVMVVDLATRRRVREIPVGAEARQGAFSPDGKTLVTQENSILTFRDVASGKQLHQVAVLAGYSGPLALSQDARRLAVLAGNSDIQVLATTTGERLALHRGDDILCPKSLAFTPAGELIAVGCRGTTAWLWKPGRQAPNLTDGHHDSIYSLKFEDGGQRLVSTDSANNPLVQVRTVANAVFRREVFTGSGSNRLEWNLKTGQTRRQPETSARRIVGREVLIECEEKYASGSVRVWEPATTREVWRITQNGIVRAQAVLSPDGRLVALSTKGERNEKRQKSNELCLWNIDTNKRMWRVKTPDGWRQDLLFSPAGNILAAHSGGATVEVRDANTGRIQQTLTLAKDEASGPLAFSPDGRTLYVGVRGPNAAHCIRRWATATWKQETALDRTSSRATALTLSPDGQTLASGHADSTILLWDLAGRAKADLVVPPMKFPPAPAPPELPAPSLSVATGEPLPEGAIQRLGTTRFRLSDPVTAATVSADGQVIAATATDSAWWRPILLFDAATGQVLRTLPKPGAFPNALALSPDGKVLVHSGYQLDSGEASSDRTAVVDVTTGAQLYETKMNDVFVCFSANGQRHTAAGIDADKKHTLEVWDVKTQERVQAFANPFEKAMATSLSADGTVVACWATEEWFRSAKAPDVFVFDVKTGKRTRKITVGDLISWAALSPDGKQVVVAEDGGSLSVWDVATGKMRFRAIAFLPHMPSSCLAGTAALSWEVADLAYSPDGKRLAVCYDDVVEIRDAGNGKPLSRRQVPEGKALSVVFLPSGDVRIVCAVEHLVYTIDGVREPPPAATTGSQIPALGLVFSRDGKTLSAFGPGVRRDWDVFSGKTLAAKRLDVLQPKYFNQFSPFFVTDPFLQLSPAGKYALVHAVEGSHSSSIGIVDLERDVRLFDIVGSTRGATTFSNDGRTAVTVSDQDKLFRWEVPSGRLLSFHAKTFQKDEFNVLAFAGSHKIVAVLKSLHETNDEPPQTMCDVRLRDTATGKEIAQLQVEGDRGCRALFSPDETLVAFCGRDGVIDVWWVDAGVRYRTMTLDKVRVDLLAFSPDGRTLAAAVHDTEDGTVERDSGQVIVWELATGRMRRRFTSVGAHATALRFSPDGRILASAHRDTTIVLWDVFGGDKGTVKMATAIQFQAWWADLADLDAVKGLTAMQQLTARPAEATALIARNLSAAKALTVAERDRLLADLDHDDFERREEASRRLRLAEHVAAPALRQALTAKPSVEQKRRLEELLDALTRPEPKPEKVKATRALEVLERIGTREAQQVLEELAKGDADAILTRDAKATLKRLGARE